VSEETGRPKLQGLAPCEAGLVMVGISVWLWDQVSAETLKVG
jgi:hypothetical protein